MYLKRALITQLGTREIRHIKTKRPEPCAIQDSDRWSCLIQFLSNFWGSFQYSAAVLLCVVYRVTSGSTVTSSHNLRKSASRQLLAHKPFVVVDREKNIGIIKAK